MGNTKITRNVQFHPAVPLIKYHQNISNSCCLSSLAYDFNFINENRAVADIVNSIDESLTLRKEKFARIEFILLMLLWQTELKKR